MTKYILIAAFGAFTLSACATNASNTAPTPSARAPAASAEQINGTNWRIISINGQPVPSDRSRPASIAFSDTQLSAYAGCNSMRGHFAVNGARLTVTGMISTAMACAPEIMEREQSVAGMLTRSVTITHSDANHMTLTASGGGKIELERAQ